MRTLKSFTVLTAFFFLSRLPLSPAVLQSLFPLNLLVGAWLTCPRCCFWRADDSCQQNRLLMHTTKEADLYLNSRNSSNSFLFIQIFFFSCTTFVFTDSPWLTLFFLPSSSLSLSFLLFYTISWHHIALHQLPAVRAFCTCRRLPCPLIATIQQGEGFSFPPYKLVDK